jgi:hypothetical protein
MFTFFYAHAPLTGTIVYRDNLVMFAQLHELPLFILVKFLLCRAIIFKKYIFMHYCNIEIL